MAAFLKGPWDLFYNLGVWCRNDLHPTLLDLHNRSTHQYFSWAELDVLYDHCFQNSLCIWYKWDPSRSRGSATLHRQMKAISRKRPIGLHCWFTEGSDRIPRGHRSRRAVWGYWSRSLWWTWLPMVGFFYFCLCLHPASWAFSSYLYLFL